jgi:hypothetical protein
MKSVFISSYAALLAFAAGCASGDAPRAADDGTSVNNQELVAPRPAPGGYPTDPNDDPCARVRCAAGTHCEATEGRAQCVEDVNPCAAVLCPVDTSCDVVDGEAVCTPLDPPSGPFCGGFGAIECPGAGTCFEDTSDDCDPAQGGADCGGVCECLVLALCVEGFVFDDSADVCACVAEEPPVDACAAVRCASGTHCEVIDDRAECVEDVSSCAAVLCPVNTTCDVVNGEAVCTPVDPPSGPFCGGFAGIECPGAGTCVDDPSDDCDPAQGGFDCGGVCDCGNVLALCIDGTVFDNSPDVCGCVPAEPPVDACSTVRCGAGTHCEVNDGKASCEPDPETNPCALVDCFPNSICRVVDGEALCVPVDPAQCGD